MFRNGDRKQLKCVLLSFVLIVLTSTQTYSRDNDKYCFEAIIVDLSLDLPYEDIAQYTCGRWDDYNSTCLNNYDGGEDILYRLDVDTSVVVDIYLDPLGTNYTAIALTNECPPQGSVYDDCIAVAYGANSEVRVLPYLVLEPGTYYLLIDTWPAPDCIPEFNLSISASDVCPDHPNNDCCNPIGINTPPEVSSDHFSTLVLGKEFVYEIAINDMNCDGSELTWEIRGLPSWCNLFIDTISGFVSCDEVDTSFVINAFDGTDSTLQTIALIVNDTLNQPHIIPPDDTMLVEFQSNFAFYPDIIDPDDSEFVITYAEIPHWCTIQNDSLIGVPPDTVYIEPITVIVEDGCHEDTMTIQTQIFLCGDFGGDEMLNLLDILFVIDYLYNTPPGPAPDPLEAGDVNHDGAINLIDILYLIDYIYSNPPGPEPQCL